MGESAVSSGDDVRLMGGDAAPYRADFQNHRQPPAVVGHGNQPVSSVRPSCCLRRTVVELIDAGEHQNSPLERQVHVDHAKTQLLFLPDMRQLSLIPQEHAPPLPSAGRGGL